MISQECSPHTNGALREVARNKSEWQKDVKCGNKISNLGRANTRGTRRVTNCTAKMKASDGNEDVGLMAARTIVCCVGLIGNILVLFVIFVLKEYQKARTHWYVLQLALADSCFLLTLPFAIVEDAYQEWTFTGSMCKAKEAILFINYYSSVMFLMVMSVDRYIAVCHVFDSKLQKLRKHSSSYVITATIWIGATLMSIPIIMYSDKRGVEPNCRCQYQFPTGRENKNSTSEGDELACVNGSIYLDDSFGYEESGSSSEYGEYSGNYSYDDAPGYNMGCSYAMLGDGWTAYIMFNFIVMFMIPLLLMTACYAKIAIRLKDARFRRKSSSNETSSGNTGVAAPSKRKRSSSTSKKNQRKRVRVTVLCLILVTLFLICWLPFHTVHLAKLRGIMGSTEHCNSLASITTVFVYLNSALNPYIYNFIGTNFKKKLRNAGSTMVTSFRRSRSGSSSYYYAQHKKTWKRSSLSTSNGGSIRLKHLGGKTADRESSYSGETKGTIASS